MRKSKSTGERVAEFRKIIGKSQTQFAAMVGVSKHTIISVENGRNQLSRNLAKRIQIATGASLEANIENPFNQRNYTREDFHRWRDSYHQTNEATALKEFDRMKTLLKVIFLAAAKSGRAGNRDRLPAVCLSLAEWLDEAREKFKLEDEIWDILEDETRAVGRSAHSIAALIEKPTKARETLAEHGIDFNKIKKELKKHAARGWLIIEDEYSSAWCPEGDAPNIPCNPRKLIPHAKYWIETIKIGSPAFDQIMKILEDQKPSSPS